LKINISQGSVATQLRCGGIYITTLLNIFHRMYVSVKKRESVNIWSRIMWCEQKLAAYFLRHRPPCSSQGNWQRLRPIPIQQVAPVHLIGHTVYSMHYAPFKFASSTKCSW